MAGHEHDLGPWTHSHVFDQGNASGERRTRWVLALTLLTMAGEIAAGWWTGSMALLADGWHMGTHALALGVAAWAYWLSRRHANDPRYAFGTWKIEVLAGFASALALAFVAMGIVVESALRLWRPEPIAASDALVVAVVGLAVNLASAWLLHGAEGGHAHGHGHDRHDHHGHGHEHHGHDHGHGHEGGADINLRAAYVHVLADALTSVFAIGALLGALWLGWTWLDPAVGIMGAVVIAVWSVGLLRQSSAVLLDREMDHPVAAEIREAIESDGDARVADLHVWRVGRAQFAAVVSLVADAPLAPADYRARLAVHEELVHVSVEVNRCPNAPR
ncbi:CDF family Co(II)/Ni(II) efflux transporter DmeF [Rhizobacter sp. LjRoot28]|uniref:CDF family Co(II)/Ni(II) efflux transporter DmeF n=1 Tax=Rhizobacter sp. LjRoot28 TaxID=3342309 RepID=UPI003ECD29C0